MSNRGRPSNCRLDHWDVEDKLNAWLEDQIKRGNADNYVWDRVTDLDTPDFKRQFGAIVEEMIKEGDFDTAAKSRVEALAP
jgi:hypothetical protein